MLLISVCRVATYASLRADSLSTDECVIDTLSEVSVIAVGARKAVFRETDGALVLDARLLGENATIAGANDPISFLHTLPAVGTNGELNASLNVRGSNNGANTFLINGTRIVNPMHMFGIYSTFNSSFFSRYTFYPSRISAVRPNTAAAMFEALSPDSPAEKLSGEISVGVLESHGTFHLPLFNRKGLLSIGGRITYLSLLFPDILKLGNSYLKYGFGDCNLSYTHFLDNRSKISATFFLSDDNLETLVRHDGSKDGDCGWGNLSTNLRWSNSSTEIILGLSTFHNRFYIAEAGRELNLPSSLKEIYAEGIRHLGEFTVETDVVWRFTSGQYNVAVMKEDGSRSSNAVEWNFAGSWKHEFPFGLSINAGIRNTVYANGDYLRYFPMPRVDLGYRCGGFVQINFSAGRYMRFDHIVEESTTGMPVDYYINSSERESPEDTRTVELGVSGTIPGLWIEFSIEGYYKRLRHYGEFAGSILDMLNPSYNPLSDLMDGRGYSCGISVFFARQFGPLRGRIGYNLGKSRLKFDRYGDSYFPSSHDRLHDLSMAIIWNPLRFMTIGATFTHATGIPYTKVKYGYIMAENLICEYYPHNSSRLPSYNRLDASASITLNRHRITVSIYNILANRNVLFRYHSFYLSQGVVKRESVMKSVIPSLSYSFLF